MHSRRFACLLLGMWLAGGFLMTWIVSRNARSVDRMLRQAAPEATLRIKVLGPKQTGLLLRYEAAELNRHSMEIWELGQIALGGFFFFFLLFATDETKISLGLALIMLAAVLVQRFAISPEILSLGRLTDFMPENEAAGYHARLIVMQGAYLGVEIGKAGVGLALAALLVGRRPRRAPSGYIRNQFNVVDKTDHGHIDR